MNRRKYIVFVIALWLLCVSTAAQKNHVRFRHLNSESGLPHQQVEALAQDAIGYIWIGTRNGLSRYDGYDIVTYYHEEGNPRSLWNNFVHNLYVDRRQRLWVSTETGVCRYCPETNDFIHYAGLPRGTYRIVENSKGQIIMGDTRIFVYDEQKDSLLEFPSPDGAHINAMTIDAADNLYLATNQGIFSYSSAMEHITRLDADYYADFITGAYGITPMMVDSKGRLWIGRNGKGVMNIDLKTGLSSIDELDNLGVGIVRTIIEDSQHRIWLGTEKGIAVISPAGKVQTYHHSYQDPNSLSDEAIYTILCDTQENIWIGSYFGGVDILLHDNGKFNVLEPGADEGRQMGRVVRMMTETSPGVFWIATEDAGISIYDEVSGNVTPFTKIPQAGSNVHSLYYDPVAQEMWIGTFLKGMFRYSLKDGSTKSYAHSDGLDSDGIFYFARQKSGRLWIATMDGLRWFDPLTNRFQKIGHHILDGNFVYTLFVDRDDNLWAGTVNFGVFRINAQTREVTEWSSADAASGLNDNYITNIFQDHEGVVWIGTNNNGLYSYSPRTGSRALTSEQQLSQSAICSINEDDSGHLWVSTSLGLYRFDTKAKNFISYSMGDGLPTNQFNFSSSLRASNGRMLFGTINGLVTFNPNDMTATKKRFAVHLKHLIINNEMITAATSHSPLTMELDNMDTIVLSYEDAHSFAIEYGVVLPAGTTSIRYQIWVEGIDKTWHDVGEDHRFVGYNMQPGKYVLHVRANNSGEQWDNCPEKTLMIVVKPPFYRSVWAYMLYLLLVLAALWFVSYFYRRRQKEKEAVRMASMEKEKLEEIDKAKFNFFTTVSHELKTPLSLIVAPLKSIHKQELSEESKYYLDMAVRNTKKMEELINELVTFNKVETDTFQFYVQNGNPLDFLSRAVQPFREASRDKSISFSMECENNGEDVWFSPSYVEYIVNNLLSNALKYTHEGGSVDVRACITTLEGTSYLFMQVSDTGIGIAADELDNIFRRYYQTKRAHNASNSGWGIGLSLVKRLVEVHKGKITVESEIGKGSTFRVWLNVSEKAFEEKHRITDDKMLVPVTEYKLQTSMIDVGTADDNDDGQEAEGGRLTILIVEDNDDMRTFLKNYFAPKYHVLTASDGLEALEIARREMVQMVISDVMMPGMDGFTLCATLKGSMDTSHIPVILLTAKNEADDVKTGYTSGAESYVSKPFEPEILELQVNNIIQLVKSRQEEMANVRAADIESTSLNALDKDFLQRMKMLVENNISNSDFAIPDITASLGVSRSLLHVKMKNLLNMSMGDYIRKVRLERACQMLREGSNVSETAYATGFSDPNYFSKTFKKHLGVSPTDYIKK